LAVSRTITDHPANLLFILATIFGIALVAVRSKLRARKRTAYATGVVVRLKMRGWNPRVPSPDIVFLDQAGVRREFSSSAGTSWDEWPVGSNVEVRYDPNDPANAELSSGELWGPALVMSIIFAAFVVIAGCLAVISGSDPYR
jgi:hypothetical protein